MKRVTFVLTVLLLSGLLACAEGAFNFPASWSQMGMPTFSTPSYLQSVSPSSFLTTSPGLSAFGGGSPLSGMQFFSPSRATALPASGIPGSDIEPILQMLSKMPTQQQMQQYYAQQSPTPTPNPVDTFQGVSTAIPADQVIFVEVAKSTTLVDPTSAGMMIPNVTMNYQFNDKEKKLRLLRKNNTDVSLNSARVVFGFTEDNDRTGRYTFDYGIDKCPGYDVPVVFKGADGRISIMLNGTRKDLMPGQQAQILVTEGTTRTSVTVTNYGLVPKANIAVVDKL